MRTVSNTTGGDVFDFVANLYDLDIETQFRTVVIKTAKELGIDIQGLEMGEKATRIEKDTKKWIDYMLNQHTKENLVYDLKKIGEVKAINSYRNFTKETIDYFKGSYSTVYERIVVPLFNTNKELIGASLRRTKENEKAKWLHVPKHLNTRLIIYNQENIVGDSIRLVEGAFDVWNLHQIGIRNAGATLGSHLTQEQEEIIIQHYTDVELIYDKDKAGLKATKKVIDQLKWKVNLTIRDLGDYNDPGEIPSIEEFNSLRVLKPYEFLKECVL